MKNKLIVSVGTYNWIKYCAGLVMTDDNKFHIMILSDESDKPIYNMQSLCKSAINSQRRHDLYVIGTKLNVSELICLGYDLENVDLHKLTSELQLKILLNNISEVYYEANDILDILFKKIAKEIGVAVYTFGRHGNKNVELDEDTYRKKMMLRYDIVGVHNLNTLMYWPDTEVFGRI